MRIKKYLIYTVVVLASFACNKHEILYNTTDVTKNTAEFQLHYFEPITNVAANYIDSVYVNNVLYSSVKGSGQLLPYNGVPGGATGRFFAVESGNVNFKFYRKGNIVYDKDVTLKPGKQNVFVHNFNQAPIAIDNKYPYYTGSIDASGVFNTDSVATVMFCNFLYEDKDTPYQGKIQYQFQNVRTLEWENLGSLVGFGESTERVKVKIIKSIFNSSGYCRVNYRMLDEAGNILQVMNTSGRYINYSDYWNGYIGRSYMHIFSGIRTAKSPNSAVKQWTSL